METEKNQRKATDVSKGIFLSFISGSLLSCLTVIVKYLTNIHPGQLALYRYLACISFSLPPLVWSQDNVWGPPGFRIYVTLQAILTATSIFFQFLCFRYLPVGEAAVILSTIPVCVTIVAKFLLKEPFGLLQTVSLLTTVIGIVLITGLHHTRGDNPRIYKTEDIYGYSVGLAAVLSITGSLIIARKCKHVSSNVYMFSTSIIGIVGSAIVMSLIGSFSLHYRGLQQILIIVLGFVSYFAVVLLLLSLHYVDAGPAATMRASSDILLSFLWQTFFFGDVPDTATVVGAILVSVSVVLLGFSKRISDIFHSQRVKMCHFSMQRCGLFRLPQIN